PFGSQLETRPLLSGGPSAAWIGQDGHDYVGPNATVAADGIQDIHIQVTGLDSLRQIIAARLLGLGGGEWAYGIDDGHWEAAWHNAGEKTPAALFVHPDPTETGRPFNLILTFDDGGNADLWFKGGSADPHLASQSASLRAAWIGQQGADLTGTSPSVG